MNVALRVDWAVGETLHTRTHDDVAVTCAPAPPHVCEANEPYTAGEGRNEHDGMDVYTRSILVLYRYNGCLSKLFLGQKRCSFQKNSTDFLHFRNRSTILSHQFRMHYHVLLGKMTSRIQKMVLYENVKHKWTI